VTPPHLYSRTKDSLLTKSEILNLLKADEATHIDEIVERLENKLSSSEIFAARFELELAGKVRPMPGRILLRAFSFELRVGSDCMGRSRGIRQTAEGMAKAHGMTLDTYRGRQPFPEERCMG
jgi:hypothetical protein